MGRSQSPRRDQSQGRGGGGGGRAFYTIAVTGFPEDASRRELQNFCRLMRGFQAAVVPPKGRQPVFVKFETEQDTEDAIAQLQGMVFDDSDPDRSTIVNAEMARRELDLEGRGYKGVANRNEGGDRAPNRRDDDDRRRPRSQSPQPLQRRESSYRYENDRRPPEPPPSRRADGRSPPPLKRGRDQGRDQDYSGYGGGSYGGGKTHRSRSRGRGGHGGGGGDEEIHTLACRINGLSERKIEEWFREARGFIDCRFNDRVQTLFVKFQSPDAAYRAIREATQEGLSAELARRNLDV